ncbi:hypothetical protein EAI_07838, partial [Harpegnathos saltator]
RPKNATNDEKALDVLLTTNNNPHTSVSRAVQQKILAQHQSVEFSKDITIILTKYIVQELSQDDYDRRVEFCDTMMTRFGDNRQFFNWIYFSDEATFELNGSINRQNIRYGADENPHWMKDSHTQYLQKVKV